MKFHDSQMTPLGMLACFGDRSKKEKLTLFYAMFYATQPCYHSDEHLAKMLGVTRGNLRGMRSRLVKEGILRRVSKNDWRQHKLLNDAASDKNWKEAYIFSPPDLDEETLSFLNVCMGHHRTACNWREGEALSAAAGEKSAEQRPFPDVFLIEADHLKVVEATAWRNWVAFLATTRGQELKADTRFWKDAITNLRKNTLWSDIKNDSLALQVALLSVACRLNTRFRKAEAAGTAVDTLRYCLAALRWEDVNRQQVALVLSDMESLLEASVPTVREIFDDAPLIDDIVDDIVDEVVG